MLRTRPGEQRGSLLGEEEEEDLIGGCGGGPSEGSDDRGLGIRVGEEIPRFPNARTLNFVPKCTLHSFNTCLLTCNTYEAAS